MSDRVKSIWSEAKAVMKSAEKNSVILEDAERARYQGIYLSLIGG